ncbi:hypothetical protein ACWATR_18390 [Nostoc sp. UIC 10890]
MQLLTFLKLKAIALPESGMIIHASSVGSGERSRTKTTPSR